MAYRDDLTALSARRDALIREVADTSDALEDAGRALDQAHGRGRLPVLDNLHVAAPCTADWSRMTGDERTRHCGDCKKNVYNLSGLTRAEAEALIVKKNGDLCVRYYQRHDGTILLADCEVGGARLRRRQRVLAISALSLAALGVSYGYLAARRPPALIIEPPTDYTSVELQPAPLPPDPVTTAPVTTAPVTTPPSHEVMGRISVAMPPKPVPTTPPVPMHIKMGKIAIRSDK